MITVIHNKHEVQTIGQLKLGDTFIACGTLYLLTKINQTNIEAVPLGCGGFRIESFLGHSAVTPVNITVTIQPIGVA